MTLATAERPRLQPREARELFIPFITPGIVRFMAAATPDMDSKRFFNPQPLKPQVDEAGVRIALRRAEQNHVAIPLVESLSIGLREVASKEMEEEYRYTREGQKLAWGESMVEYFPTLAAVASPEMQELLRDKFSIDLSKNDSTLYWEQASNLWNTYLGEKSNIKQFLLDLLGDIPDWSPQSVVEMERRITLAEPLMGIFGDERIAILARDAGRAWCLSGLDSESRQQILDIAVRALQSNFSSPTERSAYELLWDVIKDQIPSDTSSPETPPPSRQEPEPQPQAAPPQEEPQLPAAVQSPSQRREQPAPSGVALPLPAPQPAVPEQEQEQEPLQPRREPSAPPVEPPRIQEQPIVPVQVEHLQPAPLPPEVRREEGQKPSIKMAAVMARNPERQWSFGDALLARKFGNGGFLSGAFDSLDKGDKYSAAVSQKLQHTLANRTRTLTDIPPVDTAVGMVVDAFEAVQPYIDRVKKGAEKELEAQKVPGRLRKEIVNNIGTTGLVAITARDGEKPVLATINLGHSRFVAFDPQTQEVKPLTEDHTVAMRKLRAGQLASPQEAFVDDDRARLHRWVRREDVEELRRKLNEQMAMGWSQDDDVLRVSPLQKGAVYLLLTNGVTRNIPPDELPQVIQTAYRKSGQRVYPAVAETVREALRRMKKPDQYTVIVNGKARRYVVRDDASAVGIMYPQSH